MAFNTMIHAHDHLKEALDEQDFFKRRKKIMGAMIAIITAQNVLRDDRP